MNVTCPNCASVYRVDPAKVPEAGVRTRCTVCNAVFAVRREAEPAPVPQPAQPHQPPRPPAVPASIAPAPRAARVEAQRPEASAPEPAPPQQPPRPPSAPPPAEPSTRGPAAPAQRPVAPSLAATPAPAITSAPAPAAPPRPVAPARAAAPIAAPIAAPAAPKPSGPAPVPAARPAPPAGGRPANPFLSQDPSLKARRLARALISDMVVYHPGKRQEGLRDGNLKELFEEEIKKSWEEYAEQVGREVAESTAYFREALNEILAGGRQVF